MKTILLLPDGLIPDWLISPEDLTMPTLDLTVLRNGRQEAKIQAFGDPGDDDFAAWLSVQLRDWLRGHKWAEARWGEFEVEAREIGRWTLLARVRP